MKSPRAAVVTGLILIAGGGSVLGVAVAAQEHAPQPGPSQAGTIAPVSQGHGTGRRPPAPPACHTPHCAAASRTARGEPGFTRSQGPVLARSLPVSISIPAIGVRSTLLHLGRKPDGTIQVPPLNDPPITNEAAWYKYSPTPGQPGAAIIEGHLDTASAGPSVFFRLGALMPGDLVDITLADHQVAVFTITAVRLYPKNHFPTRVVYRTAGYPALRLITCGGSFDELAHHYLSNIVAFAALASAHRGQRH